MAPDAGAMHRHFCGRVHQNRPGCGDCIVGCAERYDNATSWLYFSTLYRHYRHSCSILSHPSTVQINLELQQTPQDQYFAHIKSTTR
jgi:hypothetical protein